MSLTILTTLFSSQIGSPYRVFVNLSFLLVRFSFVFLFSICVFAQEQPPVPRLTVSLTFDDSYKEHRYQADAMYYGYDMRGTFYVNSSRINSDSRFLTLEDLSIMQARGHDIGAHTIDHVRLTDPGIDLQNQICGDRNILMGLGLNVQTLAYPFGAENEIVRAVTSSCYKTARDSGGVRNYNPSTGLGYCGREASAISSPTAIPFPIEDSRYRLRSLSVYSLRNFSGELGESCSFSDMVGLVENAIADGAGGWLILNFHPFCYESPCEAFDFRASQFDNFLKYLASKRDEGLIWVRPVKDVVGSLRNGSLEGDGGNPGECWALGGYGNNTRAGGVVDVSGNNVFEVRVSEYQSGAARMYSSQDNGYCAPAVKKGDTVKLSADYRLASALSGEDISCEDVDIRWTVYFRAPGRDPNNPERDWFFFKSSSCIGGSIGWSSSEWSVTFPESIGCEEGSGCGRPYLDVPITHASVALSIYSQGELQVDNINFDLTR